MSIERVRTSKIAFAREGAVELCDINRKSKSHFEIQNTVTGWSESLY